MIKERPQVIAIQELHPAQVALYDWPFPNITQDQWINGSYEELQQRILVLLEPARNGYQREQENQQLREEKADLEEENELLYRYTVEPLNNNTVIDHLLNKLATSEGKTIEDEQTALYQWHAQQLDRGELTSFSQNQTTPGPNHNTEKSIPGYEQPHRQRPETDREPQNTEHRDEEYYQDHQSTGREDSSRTSGATESDELHTLYRNRYFTERDDNIQLRQHLTGCTQLIEDYRQQYEAPTEIQALREKVSAVENLLDMDLDALLENRTVEQWDSNTVLSPYAPERIEARLTNLESKHQQNPHTLLEEMREMIRSAHRSLDGSYRRNQEQREREKLCNDIQRHPQLIPAEKDALIGLVKESYEHYPDLDHPISIQIGQFNRKHMGMSDGVASDKLQSLNQMGCFDLYEPGAKTEVGDDILTGPATIKLNLDKIHNPLSIIKEKIQGGPRKKGCKVPTCPTPEDDVPTERFISEYHETCDSVHISAAPGTVNTANIKKAVKAINEGRVFWTGQLERFTENASEKQDAFDLSNGPHIYVDEIKTYETHLKYKQWCHMTTDGDLEDLHELAAQIGLKREWFQEKEGHPHYDLTPSKRRQALMHGAIAVSTKELIEHCHPRLASVIHPEKQDAFEPQAKENTGGVACTTCHLSIQQAEEFYFTPDGTGYCYQHGPQARIQAGERVETPMGTGTAISVAECPRLHRLRCSVQTDEQQQDGSHYATFNLEEIRRL